MTVDDSARPSYERALQLIEEDRPVAARRLMARICLRRSETPYCGECDRCPLGLAIDALDAKLKKERMMPHAAKEGQVPQYHIG